MKKILFIAHHFPPMGGPGVFRSINFVKKLPNLGYTPIVLTISEEDVKKCSYPSDQSLLEELPDELEIIRVATKEPRILKKVLMKLKVYRLFWFLFYPLLWENSALWPFFSYNTAKKTIKENNIQLIYTSSGPFSSLILGYLLKKNMKIKWVADLRDPFTDGYAWHFPSKIHWRIARLFESWILRKTDHLIVNTPEVRKLYLKRKIISVNKISVITNGF